MSWLKLQSLFRSAGLVLTLSAPVTLTACNEFGWNPLDPRYQASAEAEKKDAVTASVPPSQLSYSLSVFEGGSSIYDEYVDVENARIERRRDWSGNVDYPARGGIVTIQATGQGQVTPLQDPADAQPFWPVFSHKTLVFEKLFQSENALGGVRWRRFTVAGSVCVMFTQTLIGASNIPRRNLAGYYCAPPGTGLSEGQAETVVQSVRVRDGQS